MVFVMTYTEFRRQLGKAGLTIKEFATLIKHTPNSITNHSKHDEVPQHLAIIASLVAEMADSGLDFRSSINRIELTPNKPRGKAIKGVFGNISSRTAKKDLAL